VKSFPSGDTKSGISDMAGNVSEWTADWYGPYGEAEEVNPKGPPKGERRVVRGGDFECASDRLRSAQRGYSKPETRSPAIGFRCASGLLTK
jgi:formylglycine-generating enzyme required for sulfatase activity